MSTEIAMAAVMVAPLIRRKLTLPQIIAALPNYAEGVVIEAYDHLRMVQFDLDRCGDAAA